jgi:hypothetical protein
VGIEDEIKDVARRYERDLMGRSLVTKVNAPSVIRLISYVFQMMQNIQKSEAGYLNVRIAVF